MIGLATVIWAVVVDGTSGACGLGGLPAAGRLAGAMDGGDSMEIDNIESSASGCRLLLLEEGGSVPLFSVVVS